jgi:hypothetical protein
MEYNQNKIDALGTWPEFEKETHFYVPVDFIFFEFEDCSDYATGIEYRRPLDDVTDFVSGNDTIANEDKDYTFVQQHRSSVLTTGKLR